MSRSYRHPYTNDGGYGKLGKRLANKRVRKCKNVPSGRGYKKLYDSWNIVDHKVYSEEVEETRK